VYELSLQVSALALERSLKGKGSHCWTKTNKITNGEHMKRSMYFGLISMGLVGLINIAAFAEPDTNREMREYIRSGQFAADRAEQARQIAAREAIKAAEEAKHVKDFEVNPVLQAIVDADKEDLIQEVVIIYKGNERKADRYIVPRSTTSAAQPIR
jgi:hypothetical protein